MRLLVYDMPKAKEECIFYSEKVWTEDYTLCKG